MPLCTLLIAMASMLSSPHGPKDAFPSLTSTASSSDYKIRITTSAVKVAPSSELLKNMQYILARTVGLSKDQVFYKYTHTVENLGPYRIKVNFSEWDIIHSPLSDALQDFSFTLEPGETKIIEFTATGLPKEVVTPINLGIWDGPVGRWQFAGAGQAGLYTPPPNTFSDVQYAAWKDMIDKQTTGDPPSASPNPNIPDR